MKTSFVLILIVASVLSATADAESGDRFLDWEYSSHRSSPDYRTIKSPSAGLYLSNAGSWYFRILNDTPVDLVYFGFSPERPQLFFRRLVDGVWRPSGWEWCMSGMSTFILKKGEKIDVEITDPPTSLQVCVIFHERGEILRECIVTLGEVRSMGGVETEKHESEAANQALQTTPMTCSVYEKTIESGHPLRGV